MKTTRNLFIYVLAFSLFFLSACHDDDIWGIRGEGPAVSETRNLSEFDQIDFGVDGEVILKQGPVQEVTIEGQRNILDVLETKVRNGKLEINFDHMQVRRYRDIKVYITVPEVTYLKVSGSGRITGEEDFSVSDLQIRVSGSGDINFSAVGATNIDSEISGSGDLYLTGDCLKHNSTISGSGKIKAYDLLTEDTSIRISGSGDAEIAVSDYLKATVSGSGKVRYKGSPTVDVNISGSGKVERAD